jgi:putative membrane protein
MNVAKHVGLAVATGGLAIFAAAAPAAAAATNGQDRAWLAAAHQSNLAEIAAGQAAQSRATDARVKNLGQMFISDHTRLDASLKSAASRLGVALPSTPTAGQRAALAQAEAQSGRAFDSAWVASQLSGHEAATAATQQELSAGSDASVLQLARTASPVIAKHLAELRSLASSYGLPGGVAAGSGGSAAKGSAGEGAALGAAGVAVLVAAGYGLRRRRVS